MTLTTDYRADYRVTRRPDGQLVAVSLKRRGGRWNEGQHPRDKDGKFIRAGARVSIRGAAARVEGVTRGGRIRIKHEDGTEETVDAKKVKVERGGRGAQDASGRELHVGTEVLFDGEVRKISAINDNVAGGRPTAELEPREGERHGGEVVTSVLHRKPDVGDPVPMPDGSDGEVEAYEDDGRVRVRPRSSRARDRAFTDPAAGGGGERSRSSRARDRAFSEPDAAGSEDDNAGGEGSGGSGSGGGRQRRSGGGRRRGDSRRGRGRSVLMTIVELIRALIRRIRQRRNRNRESAGTDTAAGLDATGEVKRGSWEAGRHPRDRHGRFIRSGDSVLLSSGGRARVVSVNRDGTLDARKADGTTVRIRGDRVTRSTEADRKRQRSADAAEALRRIDAGGDPEQVRADIRRERRQAQQAESRERLASMSALRQRDVRRKNPKGNPAALYDHRDGPRARNGAGAVQEGEWASRLTEDTPPGTFVPVRGLTVNGRFIEHGIAGRDGDATMLIETRREEPTQAELRDLHSGLGELSGERSPEPVTVLAGEGAPHTALLIGTEEPLPAGEGWEHRDGDTLAAGDIIRWDGVDHVVVSPDSMEPVDGDIFTALADGQGSRPTPVGELPAARRERFGSMTAEQAGQAADRLAADDPGDGMLTLAGAALHDHAEAAGWFDAYRQRMDDAANSRMRDRARRRTREQQAREAYDAYTMAALARARDDTRGVLFSQRGNNAQVSGRNTLTEEQLFTAPRHMLRAYASEELLRWFGDNGRMTWTEFRAQYLGRPSDERRAESIRLGGTGRDWGI